jgi:hypothetical protein
MMLFRLDAHSADHLLGSGMWNPVLAGIRAVSVDAGEILPVQDMAARPSYGRSGH